MSGGFSNKGPRGGGGGGNQLTGQEVLWVQTGNAGVILIPEGTAPSATPGVGKIYVKVSDSLLYFKDDSGNEYPLTSAIAIETPAETSDDSILVYTFTHRPIYVNVNGLQYFEGAGYTWNAGTMQATLNATTPGPVGTGGFIRSAY